MQGFLGPSRFAVPVGGRPASWLRDALAVLPEPWTVLASRRRSGLDGPPWVRYVVLHPAKGIALVDVDPTEPAVAPLEDFFDHTGLAAFQSEALPIVAVTLPRDGGAAVAETIEAAFAGSCCHLGNPYWCEAVVELLLTTPELSLARLRRTVPPASIPEQPSAVLAVASVASEASVSTAPTAQVEALAPSEVRSAAPPPAKPVTPEPLAPLARANEPPTANGGWLLGSQIEAPRRTWRSWPTFPVTAAATLLAIVTLLLASPPALPPYETAATPAPSRVTASAPAVLQPAPPLTVAAVSPSPTVDRVTPLVSPAPKPASAGKSASAEIPPPPSPPSSPSKVAAPMVSPKETPPHAMPRKVARRRPVERYTSHPSSRVAPAPREQRMAVATPTAVTPAAVCADVLHPDRPGGWQYHGPPVPSCLPIRFFGFIDMR